MKLKYSLFLVLICSGSIFSQENVETLECREKQYLPTSCVSFKPIKVDENIFHMTGFPSFLNEIDPKETLPYCSLKYTLFDEFDSTRIQKNILKLDNPKLLAFKGFDNREYGLVDWNGSKILFEQQFRVNSERDSNVTKWVNINGKRLLYIENSTFGWSTAFNDYKLRKTISVIDFESKLVLIDRLDMGYIFESTKRLEKDFVDKNSLDDKDKQSAIYEVSDSQIEIDNEASFDGFNLVIKEVKNQATLTIDNSLKFQNIEYNKEYGYKKMQETKVLNGIKWKQIVLPGKYKLLENKFVLMK